MARLVVNRIKCPLTCSTNASGRHKRRPLNCIYTPCSLAGLGGVWIRTPGKRDERCCMAYWIGLSNITAVGFWDKSANVRICQLVEPSNWKGKRKSGSAAKINTSSKSLTIFGWFSTVPQHTATVKRTQANSTRLPGTFLVVCLQRTCHVSGRWPAIIRLNVNDFRECLHADAVPHCRGQSDGPQPWSKTAAVAPVYLSTKSPAHAADSRLWWP